MGCVAESADWRRTDMESGRVQRESRGRDKIAQVRMCLYVMRRAMPRKRRRTRARSNAPRYIQSQIDGGKGDPAHEFQPLTRLFRPQMTPPLSDPVLDYPPRRGRGPNKASSQRVGAASPSKPARSSAKPKSPTAKAAAPQRAPRQRSREKWADPETELDAYRGMLESGNMSLVQLAPHIWVAEVYNISQDRRMVSAFVLVRMRPLIISPDGKSGMDAYIGNPQRGDGLRVQLLQLQAVQGTQVLHPYAPTGARRAQLFDVHPEL